MRQSWEYHSFWAVPEIGHDPLTKTGFLKL